MMNTFRNTGMVMSFALSLTAVSGVIPSSILFQLFIGTFSGTLAPKYASAYLSGQSYAFGISAVLLIASLLFSLIRGKESRQAVTMETAAKIPARIPLETKFVLEPTNSHSPEPRQRELHSTVDSIETKTVNSH